MTSSFRIQLSDNASALVVQVSESVELPGALTALGLGAPRPTLVVVGGAAGLEEARVEGLRPVFATGIASVMHSCGAVGVDGGTPFGVMRLFGEAHAATEAAFPLVGVVAAGTVNLPRGQPFSHAETVLEGHHTHFIVVPGDAWGADSPWISRTATVLAQAMPSVTVLVNGGNIAYSDVEHSVDAGRQVVVVAGSGGTADALANALDGDPADDRAAALIESGLIRVVHHDQPALLAEMLAATLGAH